YVRNVEPLVGSAAALRRSVWIFSRDNIRETGCPHTLATARPKRERLTRVKREDAVGLPASHHEIERPVNIGCVRLSSAEWDVIHKSGSEVVTDVPGSAAVGRGNIPVVLIVESAGSTQCRPAVSQGVPPGIGTDELHVV